MSIIEHPLIALSVLSGQPVSIDLPSMPGAGLMWQAPAAPAGCTLVAAAPPPAPPGGGIGGPGQQRFQLTCAGAATHDLRFVLKRSWESEVRAVQRVQVQVR